MVARTSADATHGTSETLRDLTSFMTTMTAEAMRTPALTGMIGNQITDTTTTAKEVSR